MKENLFAKDPIVSLDMIRRHYMKYFETTYHLKNEDLEFRKNEELDKDDNLCKGPYLEILPKYNNSGKPIKNVVKEWSDDYQGFPEKFSELIEGGLMDYPLYDHQKNMLEEGYGKKNNLLITSGTGSGKTESFMLPLLASLFSEARNWGKSKYNPSWWNSSQKEEIPLQRAGESQDRPAAIRALVLYPMNALVADQISRLRKTLDSDKVREIFDNYFEGNRIFFGSYNGSTMKRRNKDEEISSFLKETADIGETLKKKAKDGEIQEEDIYVAPRLDKEKFGAEMLLREDMQEYAPDILVTNVSMLSIMLMRFEEKGMLDKTYEYFNKNKEAVFHLIVDELHLHRGTAGAEVAFLLRMFLNRIGVPPMIKGKPNPQLRIYASSASLSSDGNKSLKYLEEFFGVYNGTPSFKIIKEEKFNAGNVNKEALDFSKFSIFADDSKIYYDENLSQEDKEAIEEEFLKDIGFKGSIAEFVAEYAPYIYNEFIKIKEKEENENVTSTFSLKKLYTLPGLEDKNTEEKLKAIRGFFIFRSNVEAAQNNNILPNIRFHQFYKYIEGLWGEMLPDGLAKGPVGELSFNPKEVSTGGTHKMVELLRCESCGELFFGGNRNGGDGTRLSMTLNEPKIESVPNMQATPMVQRKTIDEYVVFWPNKEESVVEGFYLNPEDKNLEIENSQSLRFGLINVDGKHTGEKGNENGRGGWKECYLNPYDGSIIDKIPKKHKESFLHGYRYFPHDDENKEVFNFRDKKLLALPCQCPACSKDYLYRKYTHSPIRSFRTGIARNNQLLSKELLYQLSKNGNHEPKLIGFSDSRQDAAEQAMLIAREHYRDMLRLAMMQVLQERSDIQRSKEYLEALDDLIESIIKKIDKGRTFDKIKSSIEDEKYIEQSDKNALIKILESGKGTEEIKNEIESYSPSVDYIFELNNLISRTNRIDGEIVKKFLNIGMNPGGSKRSDNYLGQRAPFTYWDRYYVFTTQESSDNLPIPEQVKSNLESAIFDNCFGRYMHVNTEEAGLGYVMADKCDVTSLEFIEFKKFLPTAYQDEKSIDQILAAFIRIIGDLHQYGTNDQEFEHPWDNYNDCSSAFRKKVKNFALSIEVPDNKMEDFGSKLLKLLKTIGLTNEGKLKLSYQYRQNHCERNISLRFKLSKGEESYYKCEKCGRIHLHPGIRLCTNINCNKKLEIDEDGNLKESGKAKQLWKENYISYDIKTEPHSLKRLHTEELTGQTDNQIERLLKFKDIILDEQDNIKANQIDMLNVTTTMEVGVDIGSLEAIFQGNMPPTRYNYQQRAGRAGRRKQAYSLAFTFCRGRSHDTYFYHSAPEEMTGGKPADPTIAVNPMIENSVNFVIIKRIVLKHILMEFTPSKEVWIVEGGTVGQLGEKSDWETVKEEISGWIRNNNDKIDEIIKYYISQFNVEDNNFKELKEWIAHDVVNEMDNAVNNSSSNDNAQAIAEAGLLPLYGMPTNIRKLYHGGLKKRDIEKYNECIDRPLEQSISEFAPGAVKTKDSARYVAAGITIPLETNLRCNDGDEIEVNKSKLDPLEFSFSLESDPNTYEIKKIDKWPLANSNVNTFRLVIPKAFRTKNLIDNKGDDSQDDDTRSNFMPITLWVEAVSKSPIPIKDGAGTWEIWNGNSKKGNVWYINSNNNQFFKGSRYWKRKNDYTSEPRIYSLNLNTQGNSEAINRNAPNFMLDDFLPDNQGGWNRVDKSTEKIAIGAKKVTDIICIAIDSERLPDNISLNANRNNGRYKGAIKAAFYSAASLIQRTYADLIDIDPEEIEISEVKIDEQGNPSVYLSDKAPNGAGFVSMLGNFMPGTSELWLTYVLKQIISDTSSSKFIKSILSQDHSRGCSTSCSRCLNTFYNRGLHHVLDWRMGMDVIKLLLDSKYQVGKDDLRNTPYGDLHELIGNLGNRVQKANPRGNVVFNIDYDKKDWHTAFFTTNDEDIVKQEFIIHPFWKVEQKEKESGFIPQDIFRLQRLVKCDPKETDIFFSDEGFNVTEDNPVYYKDNGNEDWEDYEEEGSINLG